MEILKYKYLNKNKYKIFTDKDEFILYEDVIIKHNILLKKEITQEEINKYLKENEQYEFYYKAIDFLKIRQRSKKEIEQYLSKNNICEKTKKNIIDSLEKNGYINDKIFCQSYINDQILLKNDGPLKIINNLKKIGIEENLINENIQIFTRELQEEKIKKYIDKQIKLNRNKSLLILKNKLLNNLILMGYEREYILIYVNDIKVDEEDLYKKEYNKLYKKLSRKYNGEELEKIIKQKLYQKGFYK